MGPIVEFTDRSGERAWAYMLGVDRKTKVASLDTIDGIRDDVPYSRRDKAYSWRFVGEWEADIDPEYAREATAPLAPPIPLPKPTIELARLY